MVVASKIIYTLTDESPLLSTYSFLPIICAFIKDTNIIIDVRDISLSARIISSFSEYLYFEQRKINDLDYLRVKIRRKSANIIKLPNISASLPQLKAAIKELQNQGYSIPNYIDKPKNTYQKKIKSIYDDIKGSAVNPVLRDGNSIRYTPSLMKEYIKKFSFQEIDKWVPSSKSHIAHMENGDFYGNEQSKIINHKGYVKVFLKDGSKSKKILKKKILLSPGDIIDASFMSIDMLTNFIRKQIQDAKNKEVLLSIHLKSTMMKISDPIIFGVMVREFYSDLYYSYKKYFQFLKINLNNGINDVYNKLHKLPNDIQKNIKNCISLTYVKRPKLAMVDFSNHITNLHTPNGIIIDSSMSDMIRNFGKMWGDDGKLHDVKSIIPDRCYARMYQIIIDDCKKRGAFDCKDMGSMCNIGLMAQQAEEYGSHDTTFEVPNDGVIQVIDDHSNLLFEHTVKTGDIWRLCQTKDIAIQNWMKLAFKYSKQHNVPSIFWLDKERPHDASVIKKIELFIKDNSYLVMNIPILSPEQAVLLSMKHIRAGTNVISITGNVLRDYITDLFPILELGTSSRILSITKLISDGVLFETGAGGSAPKHVEQLMKNNHFCWDSLGEFFALAESLKHIYISKNNIKAKILSDSLYKGIHKLLEKNRLPSVRISGLDNRSSHFYLALYWAEALSLQDRDKRLKTRFKKIYDMLFINKINILRELSQVKGKCADVGGYYHPEIRKLVKVMRPSKTLNDILRKCFVLF